MNVVAPRPRAFEALSSRGYRAYLITFVLTMMADNVEHVISYWVMFQKFHSSALGGFAVVSHWVPFLVGSVAVGALNEHFDSRRLIQIGGALFMFVSCAWGYLFFTDTLEMWHAMVLLVLHGLAACFWSTSSSILLYDIVGPALLPSAVRLGATARYFGTLVGPGVGSVIMLTLGPTKGIFVNALIYLPLVLWLIAAPYGRHFRGDDTGPKRAVRGLADIIQTIRDVRGLTVLTSMIVLAGAVSFFVGNSYQAQMPGFATDMGQGDPGIAYSALLAADAAGALIAGIILESMGGIFTPAPRNAVIISLAWAVALGSFALVRNYPVALVLLFAAGFFELSFSSMVQTLVQLNAPNEIRGRVLGLYNMSASGLRLFSGITVGLAGSYFSIHMSLSVSAACFAVVALTMLWRLQRSNASVPERP